MPKHIQTKTCHIESLHPSLTYNIQRTTLSHIIIKQTTHKLRSTPSPITHMETTLKYYHIKSPKTKQSINGISGHHQTKLRILNIVIKPRIAYTNNLVPFFKLDITKLDKALIELTKDICNIPKIIANGLTHLPLEEFGIYTTSLLHDYVNRIG